MSAVAYLARRGWRPDPIGNSGGRVMLHVPAGRGYCVRMIVWESEVVRLARDLGWTG